MPDWRGGAAALHQQRPRALLPSSIKRWSSGARRWVIWSNMAQPRHIQGDSASAFLHLLEYRITRWHRMEKPLNRLRRALGFQNYWYWTEGPEQANGRE